MNKASDNISYLEVDLERVESVTVPWLTCWMSWCSVSGFSFSSSLAFSVVSTLRPECSGDIMMMSLSLSCPMSNYLLLLSVFLSCDSLTDPSSSFFSDPSISLSALLHFESACRHDHIGLHWGQRSEINGQMWQVSLREDSSNYERGAANNTFKSTLFVLTALALRQKY